ncbi:MAG: endonuclease/exonuclease/phosphatase family protein [Candidatus Limnocylindrales bacterium]
MAPTHRANSSARFAIVGALTIALLLSLAGTVAAKDKRELTAMTRNLYLGADIARVLVLTNPTDFLIAVATVYGTVLATDFPTRAAAIADEIDANHVDIVGLQEVTKWTTTGPGAPSQDFLAILQQKLADRGLSFSIAATSLNLRAGPVPLLLCRVPVVGACTVSYEDRDVILVNNLTAGLRVSNPRSGHFLAQQVVTSLAGPINFNRGWVSIDGVLDGKKFTFANTHLEIPDFAAVQQAQGREFLSGPGKAGGAVIAVGDFNSATDGSTTTTYAQLTKSWFADAWKLNSGDVGLSCCQNETLTNTTSELYSRIDLVLTHGAAHAQEVHLVGTSLFQATPPRWPSDHAGVVATVRLH